MAQTHTLHAPRFRFPKLDTTRIAAEAGAFAINGAALLLLLAPLNMPMPVEQGTDYIPVLPLTPKNPPPKPIAPPKKVEIAPPRPTHVAPTLPQKIDIPQPPVLDNTEPGDLQADPEPLAKADPGLGNAITQPLTGAHLEYLEAPAPRYPIEALRESLTGTVTLRVLVDVDGKPLDVAIERSSGHRVLDQAARKHVLAKWRFKAAMEDGRPVQAIGLVPIVFDLSR